MHSFVILGLGRFGQSVAKTLYDLGCEVLVIDENEELIQSIYNHVTHAIIGNVTDKNVLKSAGIKNFDAAVVSTGKNLETSIIVTQILKEMGMGYILAKTQNDLHARVLTKLGADRVVFPEHDMGVRIAHNLVSTNIIDYIELSPDYSIVEINLPANWEGKTLYELDIRAKYGINIIAIKNGLHINVAPTADYVTNSNDLLVVIGLNSAIDKLNSRHSKI
ncbi:MAG: potassium transporter Trk [Clostridia bacterium]|jgi:trk system potassium uptake protein TrkA|nr:potassium transporter Trk [Clostridia bacterium]